MRVPHSAIFGGEGRGLRVVQHFFNENRIRQAASSLGAAQFCINEAVAYAKERKPFGKPLSTNQAIQFPLVELQTQCEMLRALIHKTAWGMDTYGAFSQSDKVSMCNYWANRLCCEAADRAMQVHGGLGYSRHKPFEHIYRHHRRYRITEGAEEIQMRRVAGYMFGYMKQQAPKGVAVRAFADAPCSSLPTAPELLAAIGRLLDEQVLAAVPPHLQHQVRVAANLAGLVERELRLGPANAARERELIAELLGDGRRRRSRGGARRRACAHGDDADVRGAGMDRVGRDHPRRPRRRQARPRPWEGE